MKRMLAVFFVAFVVVACAGQPPITQLREDVPSYCIQSRAAYDGHMDFCAIKACPSADISKANTVQNKAKVICAKPSHTAVDLTAIKGLVNEQRTIGRAK